MTVDIICRVTHGGLVCSNSAEATKLESFIGREVTVTLTNTRNIQFHKKFFALLKCSFEMIDVDFNLRQWRKVVTVGLGHCTFVEADGRMIAIPQSISFANMDDLEFSNFYQDALQFICTAYLLDETPEQLDLIVAFI